MTKESQKTRLAVFCSQKTLLRLTKAKKTGEVQSFWAHAFVRRRGPRLRFLASTQKFSVENFWSGHQLVCFSC